MPAIGGIILMASTQKIVAALHANWLLNAIGLLISFTASVVLVRTVPPLLFAEYSAVLAIIGVTTFVFEAGANSGLTRYFHDASRIGARGTFFLRMQRRRALAAVLCALALLALGPLYARATHFASLAARPWLFALIAGIVAMTLVRLLAHYGLLALFEARTALLFQQGFQIARAVALVAVVVAGGALPHIVTALLVIAALEAAFVQRALWPHIRAERAPLPDGFLGRAQQFGMFTILDKGCAMLGGGAVLLLVLAPHHPAASIALLGLAVDLVGKIVSLTVMPLGNFVAPYLSQKGDAPEAQRRAIGRVVKLSALLYAFCIGAAILLVPGFIPVIYGSSYAGAVACVLALVVPTAFENWVRGGCSPALLQQGCYRQLSTLNVLQALATVTALWLVRERDVLTAIVAVGATRCLLAAVTLATTRRLMEPGTFRFLAWTLGVTLIAASMSWPLGTLVAQPAAAALQTALYVGCFLFGAWFAVRADRDVWHIVGRVTGRRAAPAAEAPVETTASTR